MDKRQSLGLCAAFAAALVFAGIDARAAEQAPPAAHSSDAPSRKDILKVVYIGGSITEGTNSSASEKSYASLLTAWLGTRYREVQARNLGFSGTGSEFAAYRLDHDLAGFSPDLAFLEFTVNDAGTPRALSFAQVDAIVYKLRQANPRVKVIYISTTDVGEEPMRRAGKRASWVEDAAAGAAFEELPFIDATTTFWARVIAGTPASTYLSDNVHPNDAGHRLYFETIRDALAPAIPLAKQPVVSESKLIAHSRLDTARFEKGSSAAGCRPGTLNMKYMDAALACDQGDSFVYRFTGTTVGVVRAMVRDGGRLACTMDGGNPIQVDFYESATRHWERTYPQFLYRQLTPGTHALACSVTNALISLPEGTSTGHKATIGYFVVSDARPVTIP